MYIIEFNALVYDVLLINQCIKFNNIGLEAFFQLKFFSNDIPGVTYRATPEMLIKSVTFSNVITRIIQMYPVQ